MTEVFRNVNNNAVCTTLSRLGKRSRFISCEKTLRFVCSDLERRKPSLFNGIITFMGYLIPKPAL